MKLVEAEAEGPIEGEDAVVTAPRPLHRRVSVSLLLTLAVLIGTVVAIYVVFPARHNLLLTDAIELHRDAHPPPWDLANPSEPVLRAWAGGLVGKDVPLPRGPLTAVGVREIMILDRRAALIELQIAGERVTYMVQHHRGMAPERAERVDGDLRAVAWRTGKYTCVAVGPAATSATWLPAFR
jgi:hypothetical protein